MLYEVVPIGQRWEGHEGARTFYTTFLSAFLDVHFDLQDIVIGPQGVIEVAKMTIIIHFPWNPAVGKFAGERVYFDHSELISQMAQGR